MSSICGIINFDGAPVDPLALQKMADAAAYSGPDGTHSWIDGNAGFAHLALHTTPEAVFEQQPMRDPQTGLIWVADARVDNRDELIDFFKKHGDIQSEGVITDVELLMLAYRYWGDDFLPHIYGNYAFVMWNPATQKALAGRDFLGLRPMFYMRHGQTFYFASVIRSILAVLPERPPLNELLIADYYRYNFDRWIAETIYLPIRRLPASCQVAVDACEEKIHQHWMIVNAPILRYKNDQDYYDQFMEIFETALKACARTADPLGIHVSGGIDSSSITCTLHKMWTEYGSNCYPPTINLYYMHHAYDHHEEESQYHDAVIKACPQFHSTIISGENHWGLKEIGKEQDYHPDEPEMRIIRSLITARLRQSRKDGCRVVIQGIGGDELFQIRLNALDYLSDLPPKLLVKALQSYYCARGFHGIIKLAIQSVLYKSHLHSIWSKIQGESFTASTPWLLTEWSQRLVDNPPEFKLTIPAGFCSNMQRINPTTYFASGSHIALRENSYHLAIENNIEVRYPFLDRKLLEFVYRLPTEKILDFKLVLKPFLKTAMANILPKEILHRKHKSVLADSVYNGLKVKERSKAEELLNNARKEQAKFVDFSTYGKHWVAFLNSTEIVPRALFSPLLLQAWNDDTIFFQDKEILAK